MIGMFKHLLPTGRALNITQSKPLRWLFQGLSVLPENFKPYADQIFEDIDPQKTTKLTQWEQQFGMQVTTTDEQTRRDRLSGVWAQLYGGQSPRYIQDALQAAGFDVYVHPWWEDSARPLGGSVNGDATPVARSPFDQLWSGGAARQYVGTGHVALYCGGDSAFSNSQNSPPGYALVNKVPIVGQVPVGCGHTELYCGGGSAYVGSEALSFSEKVYPLPNDVEKFPYFVYIGGQTYPEVVTIPLDRKDELERLCLQICPSHNWLGMLITYS